MGDNATFEDGIVIIIGILATILGARIPIYHLLICGYLLITKGRAKKTIPNATRINTFDIK